MALKTMTGDPNVFILIEVTLKENYGWTCNENCQENTTCVICYDSVLGKYTLGTPCGHVYHAECILHYIVNYKAVKCFEPECGKAYKYLKVPPGFEKSNLVPNKKIVNETYINPYFQDL